MIPLKGGLLHFLKKKNISGVVRCMEHRDITDCHCLSGAGETKLCLGWPLLRTSTGGSGRHRFSRGWPWFAWMRTIEQLGFGVEPGRHSSDSAGPGPSHPVNGWGGTALAWLAPAFLDEALLIQKLRITPTSKPHITRFSTLPG